MEPIPLQPVSDPADHQDPRDLERQSRTHRSASSMKRLSAVGGLLATILFIIGAVIWDVALPRKTDYNSIEAPEVSFSVNCSTMPPVEVQTVYENVTIFFYTTTRVPLLVAPSLATSTIVLSSTPRSLAIGAPLRSTTAYVTSKNPLSEISAPSANLSGDVASSGCFLSGA